MRDENQFIAVHWDFKKVLAAIIYVLRHSNSEETSAYYFAVCLQELRMCSFGKLVNLLSIVQDLLIDEKQFNYEQQEFSSFSPVLDKMIEEIKSRLGKEQAPSALTEWFLDISRSHFPENWTRYTLKIQGIINEVFAATGDYFDSNNFFELRKYIIMPLIEKLIHTEKVEVDDQHIIQKWYDILKDGIVQKVEAFFNKIKDTNIDDIENLFTDIFDHSDELYGDFTFINAKMIRHHYVQMQKNQGAGGEKAYKFLEQLILNTNLNAASIDYIKGELNIKLFEQLKNTPEQCSKIIDDFVEKFEKHSEFKNKIIDFSLISATQIIELLQVATGELINLLVNNEHILINWLAVTNTDNTPLCELAQMKDGCYQSQAMELYDAHPEWSNLVHENWIVELSGAGNESVLD